MRARQAKITKRNVRIEQAENGFIITGDYRYTAIRDVWREPASGIRHYGVEAERRAQNTSASVTMTAQDTEEAALVVRGLLERTHVELRPNEEWWGQ